MAVCNDSRSYRRWHGRFADRTYLGACNNHHKGTHNAGVKNPLDMENIKLALQSYNYGNGYLEWTKARGGYTLANAAEFSDMMAQRMGWSSYGDKQYVLPVSYTHLWFLYLVQWS